MLSLSQPSRVLHREDNASQTQFYVEDVVPELISTLAIRFVKVFISWIADERGVYGVGWEEALIMDKSSISD
jgi:hypothetical protein